MMTRKFKFANGLTGFSYFALVIACLFLIWRQQKLAKQLVMARVAVTQCSDSLSQVEKQFQLALKASHGNAGEKVRFPEMTALGSQLPTNFGDIRVVLYFSELACDTCLDQETRFVKELAQQLGPERVAIVGHAAKERTLRVYKRQHGLQQIPVFFDRENRFKLENRLLDSPMLLWTNERQEIVACHWPIPGKEQPSESFHNSLRRYFQLSAETAPSLQPEIKAAARP